MKGVRKRNKKLYEGQFKFQQITKRTTLLTWNQRNTHKKTTYSIGNLGPGLGQTQKCDRGKLVNN